MQMICLWQVVLHTETKRGVIGEFIASITLFFSFYASFLEKYRVFEAKMGEKWAEMADFFAFLKRICYNLRYYHNSLI
jgi:hypothetical protein